jgi:hypothetical protein
VGLPYTRATAPKTHGAHECALGRIARRRRGDQRRIVGFLQARTPRRNGVCVIA